MEEKDKNSRRKFLKNSTLTVFSAGILSALPRIGNSQPKEELACNPTTLDYYGQGPFYLPNAPEINNNQLAAQTETGTRLILSGVVRTLDCSAVIANCSIDIWHANDAGQYDNSGFGLRGKTYSNAQGFYFFETIYPGKYLNGSKYRPSHIHFKIKPPDYPEITTQLYFQGDSEIPGDAAASITSGPYDARHRIIPVSLNADGKYEGTWDIVVDGATTGMNDLFLENGMLYSVAPNPFRNHVEIEYGLFKKAKAGIHVYDLQGRQVASLDEQTLGPQKYKATWIPGPDVLPGIYWVALKVNDLQVHYLKLVKTN